MENPKCFFRPWNWDEVRRLVVCTFLRDFYRDQRYGLQSDWRWPWVSWGPLHRTRLLQAEELALTYLRPCIEKQWERNKKGHWSLQGCHSHSPGEQTAPPPTPTPILASPWRRTNGQGEQTTLLSFLSGSLQLPSERCRDRYKIVTSALEWTFSCNELEGQSTNSWTRLNYYKDHDIVKWLFRTLKYH